MVLAEPVGVLSEQRVGVKEMLVFVGDWACMWEGEERKRKSVTRVEYWGKDVILKK